MGALFSRIKTWGSTDTLTAADLNAEFNNILNNFIPTMMQGYSVNATQMQIQTNPGTLGSESLAAALSGELERLRYQLAAIAGTTYWYQTPVSSILTLNNALGASTQANKISSGLTAATTGINTFLVPNGSIASVVVKGSGTPLVYTINSVSYTISSDLTLGSLAVGTTLGQTAVVSDATLTAGCAYGPLVGENGSYITLTTAGSAMTALESKIGAFQNATTSEYFMGRVDATAGHIYDCYRGYFMNSSSAFTARAAVTGGTSGDTIKAWQLNWIYATTAGTLTYSQTNPTYSPTAPGTPSTGDYWFDMVNNIFKVYSGGTWSSAAAMLLGVAVCNSTACVAARSFDSFGSFNSLNTIELFVDQATLVRVRFQSGSISVFGTTVTFPHGYPTWSTTLYEGGTANTANTYYYLYLSPNGTPYTSTAAPYNRPDLQGYYHPFAQFRCLGYVLTDAAGNFLSVESFYKTAPDVAAVTTATAAWNNVPLTYIVPPRAQLYEFNCVAGITQVLPHPNQWKGQRLIYVKTDSTANPLTIQSFGNTILTTTCNTTFGQTIIGTLAATTGLLSGVTYLISGSGIPFGTTATYSGSTTNATLGQNAYATVASSAITFGTTPIGNGIQVGTTTTIGQYALPLYSQNESLELISDGFNAIVLSHYIPANYTYTNLISVTASTTAPTKGVNSYEAFWWRRVGGDAEWRWDMRLAAGTAGSGDYIINLPAPINTIDLSRVQVNASVFAGAYPTGGYTVVGSGFQTGSAPTNMWTYVASTSTLKAILGGNFVWASGNAGNMSAAISQSLSGKLPITGWWG